MGKEGTCCCGISHMDGERVALARGGAASPQNGVMLATGAMPPVALILGRVPRVPAAVTDNPAVGILPGASEGLLRPEGAVGWRGWLQSSA